MAGRRPDASTPANGRSKQWILTNITGYCSIGWRATTDEDEHYVYAIAL